MSYFYMLSDVVTPYSKRAGALETPRIPTQGEDVTATTVVWCYRYTKTSEISTYGEDLRHYCVWMVRVPSKLLEF